jgi:regulatory protein
MSESGSAAAHPRLARVSYLPGVVPPPRPVESEVIDAVETETPTSMPARAGAFDVSTLERLRSMIAPAEGAFGVVAATKSEITPESAGERSARAHNISMHALTRKGVSSIEMVELLRSRELDESDVQFEVEHLEQVGLLNDDELASTLVRTLRERKGLGRSAISAELRRRKIDATAIATALDEVADDELERALEVAIKRAPQLRSLDQETARRRLGAFLMRKGYSGSVVSAAVTAALSGSAGGRGGSSGRGPRFE